MGKGQEGDEEMKKLGICFGTILVSLSTICGTILGMRLQENTLKHYGLWAMILVSVVESIGIGLFAWGLFKEGDAESEERDREVLRKALLYKAMEPDPKGKSNNTLTLKSEDGKESSKTTNEGSSEEANPQDPDSKEASSFTITLKTGGKKDISGTIEKK